MSESRTTMRTMATSAAGTFLLLAALGCLPGPTEIEPPPDGTLGVLFVGNSLTYENALPAMLELLLEAGLEEDVHVASEARPNWGLPDHWASGGARQTIAEGGWTFVVLQQGPSATEGRPYLLDYAERFAPEIRSAGGEPALYMVWPAESRFFDFDGVLDSYRTAAENVDGYFFPAGEAWRVAWETDSDLPLYGPDRFHPSVEGSYLAALVMYEQISGLDARDRSAADARISVDPDTDELLKNAAHEANARHARVVGTAGG